MLISTVLMWLLIAVAIALALPSVWLVAEAMNPEGAGRRRERAAAGFLRNLLAGLLPAVAAFVLAAGLLRVARGAAGVFVLAGVGMVLIWALVGAGGLARLVGERLWPEVAETPRRSTARGGGLLVGCCLLPIFGWFGLLPLLLVTGLGIQVRGWFGRRQPRDAAPAAGSKAAIGDASVPQQGPDG